MRELGAIDVTRYDRRCTLIIVVIVTAVMETSTAECSLLREWLSLAGIEKAAIRDMAAAWAMYQVHARFDAARIDEDAMQLREEPAWIRSMIAEARWRPLLCELCVAHPQSALMQATGRTLSESEHAAEVQANTSICTIMAGASSMQAFVASVAAQLNSLRQGQAGAQARLDGLTNSGEPEFLHAQLMLRAPPLACHAEFGGLAEQAAASTARAAARTHGQAYRRLHLLAAGVPRGATLMSSLVSVLTVDGVCSADAHTLDDQCAKGVSTAALRDPAVLQLLLLALFDPLRPPKAAPREQLLRALARAAADAAAAADDDDDDVVDDATCGSGGGMMDLSVALAANSGAVDAAGAAERRGRALDALRETQAICERNEVSEVEVSVARLAACSATEPASACGVLLWARRVLTSAPFSGARCNSSFLPPVLKLLMSIAHRHPALQGEVCRVVHAILDHEPTTVTHVPPPPRRCYDGGPALMVVSARVAGLGGRWCARHRHAPKAAA